MKLMRTAMHNREGAIHNPLPVTLTRAAVALMLTMTVLLVHVPYGQAQAKIRQGSATQQSGTQAMVLIPGGEFNMGNEGAYADEMPRHTVRLDAFYVDAHEVTNTQFTEFVKATGYVTQAERDGHCWAFLNGETDWHFVAGTDWRHPQGSTSTIEDKMNHPVVCVTWADAAAYATWAGKRLPTEAEWEYVSRATSTGHFIANTESGDHSHSGQTVNAHILAAAEHSPSSKSHSEGSHHHHAGSDNHEQAIEANVWQGHWPEHNALSDGFYYTAPAAAFAPNQWGVYDMLGNVWEWTADWYDSTYYAASPIENPQGPVTGKNRVARGGSWFCSPNYCGAYSSHYRGASPPDHAFNNVGFRCAMDVPDGK